MPASENRSGHQDIRIGTIVNVSSGVDYVKQILPYGFECFQAFMWGHIGNANLPEYAKAVLDVIGDQAIISSIGMFGNPLQDEQTAKDWETCIRSAKLFRCSLVCGFAGAQEDRSVPENMPKFKEVFGHLAKVAADEGVRIAFENCDMGGDWNRPKWNIAHAPRAWEMMFNEVPGDVLGLEWEPCHQMNSLIEPLPQLRKWVHRVYHVHGKDATVLWDVIREKGLRGGEQVVYHRTPGFGDTNWTDVISILRSAGYRGCIDVELQAQAGDFVGGQQTLARIMDSYQRSVAFRALAKAYAHSGDTEGALNLEKQVHSAFAKAEILIGASEGILEQKPAENKK